MESRHHLTPIITITIITFLALAACIPIQTQPAPASATETPTTPPTATIQWFPSTSTPTPRPVITPSATPIYLPGLGNQIFTDDFASPANWNTVSSNEGSVSVSRNRITVAVKTPDTYLFSLRNEPLLSDFYAEINAHPALCRGADSYGLLFRANNLDAYRFALACDGVVSLEFAKAYNHPRVLAYAAEIARHSGRTDEEIDYLKRALAVEQAERDLGIRSGQTTPDLQFTLEQVNCVGACALGPLAIVDAAYQGSMTPDKLGKLLRKLQKKGTD